LLIEVNLAAYRLAKKNELSVVDYHNLMMNNIDEVTNKRLQALREIEKDKIQVAKANNKKVNMKSFQVGVTPGFKAKPDAHRMYAQDQVVIHTVRM
jgi:hypothetical protein